MSRTTRKVGVLVVVGATTGGALVAHAAEPISEPAAVRQPADRVRLPPAPPPAETGPAQALLTAINVERARRGLAPYDAHPSVGVSASLHAADMAAHNDLDHRGSNGSNAGDRLRSAGFVWTSWGENIGAGFADPASMLSAWMNSPSHRPNILSYNQFAGIGVAPAANGTLYWVLVVANS